VAGHAYSRARTCTYRSLITCRRVFDRTGIDQGTLYPILGRMHRAGWLSSHPEDEQSWLAGAPPERGPGRRRTYDNLTPKDSAPPSASFTTTNRTPDADPKTRHPPARRRAALNYLSTSSASGWIDSPHLSV
jgi:hypothetical protein